MIPRLLLQIWIISAILLQNLRQKNFYRRKTVENPIFYPPQEILDHSEVFVNLPEETSLLLDSLWAEVKMGGPGDTATLVAVLAAFLLLYIGIVVYKKMKVKRELK
ncbi:hypothetical protein [Anaeromassilibacillus sp. SJQ-1]|uniref:hypothetical protein n=1 Tax=Anaeromassilibacillus sp. SJQ-1 TaxID=3375419 RepID=UPI00398930B9